MEEGYFGYLGTSDSSGTPHVTPVIFVWAGSSVFLTISKAARKLSNIRQNGKVAFLVDIRDPRDLENNRAVLIEGTAEIFGFMGVLKRLRTALKVRALFLDKYPKYAGFYRAKRSMIPKLWRATMFTSRLLVEVKICSYSYIRQAKPLGLRSAFK